MKILSTLSVLAISLYSFAAQEIPLLAFSTEAHVLTIGELELNEELYTGGFRWVYGEPDHIAAGPDSELQYYDRYGMVLIVKNDIIRGINLTYQPDGRENFAENAFPGSLFFGPLTLSPATRRQEFSKAGAGFSCSGTEACLYKKPDEKLKITGSFSAAGTLTHLSFYLNK